MADIIKPQTYPWQVFCYDPNRQWPDLPAPIRAEFGSVQTWQQQSSATRPGVRFLTSPTGLPDLRVNAFFTSEGMLFRSEHTQRKYAYALAGWLNFLARLDPSIAWDQASEQCIADYKFWRMTDERNPRRVVGSTWYVDLAALATFYSWASRL